MPELLYCCWKKGENLISGEQLTKYQLFCNNCLCMCPYQISDLRSLEAVQPGRREGWPIFTCYGIPTANFTRPRMTCWPTPHLSVKPSLIKKLFWFFFSYWCFSFFCWINFVLIPSPSLDLFSLAASPLTEYQSISLTLEKENVWVFYNLLVLLNKAYWW